MTNNIIIFGSNGQDGYYLDKFLSDLNFIVIKISRTKGEIVGDVTDYSFVSTIIQKFKPQFVFNFAAISSTSHNFLFENHNTISLGTINILESVKNYSPNTKVFLSGSALQFENKDLPINEKTPFKASSPYSIARISSVYSARYYSNVFGLNVYIGYFFNHDSPLRTENHINQKIVKAAQRINSGSNEKLLIGDVNVSKEFNFAGDIIEAIWVFINQTKVKEVVIGTGLSYMISDWLDICFNYYGLQWQQYVEIDKTFVTEYRKLVSDPQLIMSLGWKPKTTFEDLSKIMLQNLIV